MGTKKDITKTGLWGRMCLQDKLAYEHRQKKQRQSSPAVMLTKSVNSKPAAHKPVVL